MGSVLRYAVSIASFLAAATGALGGTLNPLGLDAGANAVGFRIFDEVDRARTVTGGFATAPHPRPLRIYFWYPSERRGKPVTFGRYAELADQDVWGSEIVGPLRARLTYSQRPLARSLSGEDYRALLERPMRAAENARASKGPFPLIAIGQGLYYESPIAFAALGEYLASHGFAVVTTPLMGANSPLVKLDAQDLEDQIRDLELAVAHARELPHVSDEMLGVLGFDMGGMVGVLLSMRNADVDAFASLDAGILFEHESGLPRASPGYDPAALRIPWLHATPPRGLQRPGASAESLFELAVHANRYLLVTDGMGHVDFTSYALVEGRRDMLGYWPEPGATAGSDGHRAVASYLLRFFSAYLKRDTASLERLDTIPETAGARMTLEHRPSTPPPFGHDELVADIVAGRAAESVTKLRASPLTSPLLDRMYLERLTQHLLFTWALADEALPVIELLTEVHPDSMLGRYLVGEAHVLRDDYSAAIAAYERLLMEFPNDVGARARLEELRAR